MFKRTKLLDELFYEYDISGLPHGIKEDKLGDLFEDYCAILLSSDDLLDKAKNRKLNPYDTDDFLYNLIVSKARIDIDNSYRISANRDVKHRLTGGNAKTDVIAKIEYDNEDEFLPISVKQTTVAKVAMAEFDADTIIREIGITDPIVQKLLLKHQVDASAKNFTTDEKIMLTNHLRPYARSFVRWVLTGTPIPSDDLRFPQIIVKFQMSKYDEILDIAVYDMEEYVNSVMLDRYGNVKSGGFGTGLGWTYATGSKGKKIQFKG